MKRGNSIMPVSESKKRWEKDNMLLIGLKLHKAKDADIIDFLTVQGDNKQKAIKAAIREYIAAHPQNE